MKPEFEEFTGRPTVRVSSNPLNAPRREGYFRPAAKPDAIDKIKQAADRHRTAGKRLLAAGAAVGALTAGVVGLNAMESSGDTTIETSLFSETLGKDLKSKSTKVIIREGANVRTSPAVTEDKASASDNVAFNDRNLEVTEGVYYGDWLGFQLEEVQPGTNVSPEEAADNTYWVNLGQLKKETRADGTSFASEYVIDNRDSAEELQITLGNDGVFHDAQQNRVAVAREIAPE